MRHTIPVVVALSLVASVVVGLAVGNLAGGGTAGPTVAAPTPSEASGTPPTDAGVATPLGPTPSPPPTATPLAIAGRSSARGEGDAADVAAGLSGLPRSGGSTRGTAAGSPATDRAR